LNPLASASTCAGRSVQKKGNITTELGCQFGQLCSGPADLPRPVCSQQYCRRIAGSASQPGGRGDSLGHLNRSASVNTSQLLQTPHDSHNEIVITLGKRLPLPGGSCRARRQLGPGAGEPTACEPDLPIVGRRESQRVEDVDRCHQCFNVMKAVIASREDLQKKIDLGWRQYFDVCAAKANVHTSRGLTTVPSMTFMTIPAEENTFRPRRQNYPNRRKALSEILPDRR
jgi:hypothetical protein